MRSGGRLGQLRGLARLQEVLTSDATAELADARDTERSAQAAAADSARRVEETAEHWYRHLSGPVMPERGIALAALLIERERNADENNAQASRAEAHSTDCEQSWRTANATERATQKVVATLKRKSNRKSEERALDVLADRVTIDWMKR